MTTRTWISDAAANSDAGFDGTPEAGDDLVFTSAHTGQCTINQALTFGAITLENGCGTVIQGAVDFGYTSLIIGGGVWTGVVTQWQTLIGGAIVKTGGTLTNLKTRLKTVGSTSISLNAETIFYSFWNTGTLNITSSSNIYVGYNISTNITIFKNEGVIHTLANIYHYAYNSSNTILNTGEIHSVSKKIVMMVANQPVIDLRILDISLDLMLVNTASSKTITLSSDLTVQNGKTITLSSLDALGVLTYDVSGRRIKGAVVVGTRAVLKSSVSGANLYADSITVLADGSFDRANINMIQCDGNIDMSAGASENGTETWVLGGGVGKTIKLAAAQSMYNVVVKGSASPRLLANATIANLYAHVNTIDANGFTLAQTHPEKEYAGLRRPIVIPVKKLDIGPTCLADGWMQELGAAL